MATTAKFSTTVGLNTAFAHHNTNGIMLWAKTLASFYTNYSRYVSVQDAEYERESTHVDDSTRNFIKLEQSFLNQLYKVPEGTHSKYDLKEKMKISSDLLLLCSPDAISLQLTEELSIFYTVRKNDITIYLQHYLIDEFDDADEVIVSVYKEDTKLLDYGGSLGETISQLNDVLVKERISLPEFA